MARVKYFIRPLFLCSVFSSRHWWTRQSTFRAFLSSLYLFFSCFVFSVCFLLSPLKTSTATTSNPGHNTYASLCCPIIAILFHIVDWSTNYLCHFQSESSTTMSFQLRTLSLNTYAPRYDQDMSVTNLLVRNTFLVFRLAFLGEFSCYLFIYCLLTQGHCSTVALLTNFAFLTLIFASWNVHATQSLGLKATSTSIFVIFESCLTFACVILSVFFFVDTEPQPDASFSALVDFVRPKVMTSRTMFECIWVGVLSIFQMGTSISF